MNGAIDALVASMRARGLRAVTVDRVEAHLRTLLDVAKIGARSIRVLTPAKCADLYRRAQAAYKVDTHRNALAVGRQFGAWLVDSGWLRVAPFADVKPVGRRNYGKPQLGIDDSRTLIGYCVANPADYTIATACCLLLGVRASELVSRDVRDLDDGGRILRVTASKTYAGLRSFELPDVLRAMLLAHTKGRAPTAPLFPGSRGRVRRSRFWVRDSVERACDEAGVPYVPPHGLRGTHGTLATAAAQTPRAVSEALGHSSMAITARAYVDKDAARTAASKRAWTVIDGGRAGNGSRDSVPSAESAAKKSCEGGDSNPDGLATAGT